MKFSDAGHSGPLHELILNPTMEGCILEMLQLDSVGRERHASLVTKRDAWLRNVRQVDQRPQIEVVRLARTWPCLSFELPEPASQIRQALIHRLPILESSFVKRSETMNYSKPTDVVGIGQPPAMVKADNNAGLLPQNPRLLTILNKLHARLAQQNLRR